MEIKPISLELSEGIKRYIEIQKLYRQLAEEEFIKMFRDIYEPNKNPLRIN